MLHHDFPATGVLVCVPARMKVEVCAPRSVRFVFATCPRLPEHMHAIALTIVIEPAAQ